MKTLKIEMVARAGFEPASPGLSSVPDPEPGILDPLYLTRVGR